MGFYVFSQFLIWRFLGKWDSCAFPNFWLEDVWENVMFIVFFSQFLSWRFLEKCDVYSFFPNFCLEDFWENGIFMCVSQFLPWRFWENVMFIGFFSQFLTWSFLGKWDFMCFSQFLIWRFLGKWDSCAFPNFWLEDVWENVMFIVFFPNFWVEDFWTNVMFILFFPIFALKIFGKMWCLLFFPNFDFKMFFHRWQTKRHAIHRFLILWFEFKQLVKFDYSSTVQHQNRHWKKRCWSWTILAELFCVSNKPHGFPKKICCHYEFQSIIFVVFCQLKIPHQPWWGF